VETGNIQDGQKTEQEILTRVVLENVLVLAVDQRSRRIALDTGDIDSSAPGNVMRSGGMRPVGSEKISTATLAVKPDDCLKLNLAQEIGSLSIALRSAWSQGQPWVKKSLESHDFLGINKPLLPRSMPPWVEIRGSEQMSRY
jgi:Flp pilus assembly protein CpaB